MIASDSDFIKAILFDASGAEDEQRTEIIEVACSDRPWLDSEIRSLAAHLSDSDDPTSSLSAESRRGPAPTTIGRYEVLEYLGRGGMGEVYLATEPPPLSRRVAVKIMRSDLAGERLRRRLEFERDALVALRHECIARVLDAGTLENGDPFVAMEYIDGPHLLRAADDAELGVEDRLRLVERLCAAVSHAHKRGFVHRDIKPSNVLTERVGEELVPKLIDFGIAKLIDDSGAAGETMQGIPLGTLEYMSPEQSVGLRGLVDQRSDIYSVGVLLHELVTGHVPLSRSEILDAQGESLDSLYRKSDANTIARRIGAAGSGGSLAMKELAWVIAKATAFDPDERYQSADVMRLDLERLIAGKPATAAPPSRVYAIRKAAKRNPLAALGLGTAVVAVIVSIAVLLVSYQSTTAALRRTTAAEATAREALADSREALDFFASMMRFSSPSFLAKDASIMEMLEQGADLLDVSIEDRPGVSWDAHRVLAVSFTAWDNSPRALEQIELAERDAVAAFGDGSPQHGAVLSHKARVLTNLLRNEEAVAAAERAIEILSEYDSDWDNARYEAQMLLANLDASRGRYEAATGRLGPLIDEMRLKEASPTRLLSAITLRSGLLGILGRDDEAWASIDEGKNVIAANPSMPLMFVNYLKTAESDVASFADQPERGIGPGRDIVEFYREWLGRDHRLTLSKEIRLIELELKAGDEPRESIRDRLREVLRLCDEKFDGAHELRVFGRLVLGELESVLGEQESSITLLEEALAMSIELRGPIHPHVALIKITLAQSQMVTNDLAGAERSLDEAESILVELGQLSDETRDHLSELRARIAESRQPAG
ncbi:MAG: serine/threonine-protein kinase [Planctomycetota bacterium]